MRVLLVEDNKGDARLILEYLRDEPSVRLETVGTLADAAEAITTTRFDAVLLDLGLPDSQGLDTLRSLVSHDPSLPIVVLTGQDDSAIADEAVNEGAQDYLCKGQIDGSLLLRVLRYARDRNRIAQRLIESEKALKRSNEELKNATSRLVQTEQLKSLGELAAGVAHELNQPLNAIGLITQQLLREHQSCSLDDIKTELTDIRSLAASMGKIVDELRIFVRAPDQLELRQLDANSIVEGTLRFIAKQIENHRITLRRELAPDLPPVVGDPSRLTQVLLNLIINARDALNEVGSEGKSIVIATSELTLSGKSHEASPSPGRYVAMEIRDNGPGIKEDRRQCIFNAFFTTKPQCMGTGLGLSICKRIVDEHHGQIDVFSIPGQGSSFRVLLPACDDNMRCE